jgi:arginine decarboxylase
MPIHRLDQRPTEPAILGDITCDSDGKIDRFIDRRDVARTVLLHVPTDPYFLGAFLVGAYQEILGDLHNLFGDTNAVHISMTDEGEAVIESVVKGDTVKEVLHYVQYNDEELLRKMQSSVESAVQSNQLDNQEAGRFLKFYENGLLGYTYLE